MKNEFFNPRAFICLFLFPIAFGISCKTTLIGQNISKSYKDDIITMVSKELNDRYVFQAVAQEVGEHLQKENERGRFNSLNNHDLFAKELTTAIYEVAKDKHVTVNLRKPRDKNPNEEQDVDWISEKLEGRNYMRRYNANFKAVEKLDNNIGYLDLRGFYGLDMGKEFADHAMAQLKTSDAIIIDLRENSGGRGDMVNYLLSYFFDEEIITSKSRKRIGDNFVDRISKTPHRLVGKSMPQIPLFVLTSSKTFSAAEAFSFPLQVYDRAIFIGEQTKGGANAGDLIPLDDVYEVFIPDVAGLPHPVSKEVWEGIGIIPDVKSSATVALTKGIEMATNAAMSFKTQQEEIARKALLDLNEKVKNYDGTDEQDIINAYLLCKQYDIIFEEWELNRLGYQFMAEEKLKKALVIFKTNTVLYPNSAKTFDSYAEALIKTGNRDEGIKNYRKAVSVATKYKLVSLDIYIANLEKANN